MAVPNTYGNIFSYSGPREGAGGAQAGNNTSTYNNIFNYRRITDPEDLTALEVEDFTASVDVVEGDRTGITKYSTSVLSSTANLTSTDFTASDTGAAGTAPPAWGADAYSTTTVSSTDATFGTPTQVTTYTYNAAYTNFMKDVRGVELGANVDIANGYVPNITDDQ
jgi:hypothetical protein